MTNNKGVRKTLRTPKPRKSVDEWVQTGAASNKKKTQEIIPEGIENDGRTSVSVPKSLLFEFEDLLTQYRRNTGEYVSRSELVRIWLYAVLNAPEDFQKKLLSSPSENEMLQVILEKLQK